MFNQHFRESVCGLILSLSLASAAHAAVWQWSVPVPSLEGRRAYLWIAPDCKRVRGLIVACHNMLEQPLFERPAFRAAAAEEGLGILMVYSGHDRGDDDKHPDHPKRSSLDIFLNPNFPKGSEDPKGAGEDLQKALDALADESGYAEVRYAPLLPVGHSSAGSFVWHLYRWDASRIFAMMPFKTGPKDDGPQGIPIFEVNSEWFDYGGSTDNCWSTPGALDGRMRARANGNQSLFGYYADIGSGHCNVSDDSIRIAALFLKKAVAARIPDEALAEGPVKLKPVTAESGWLLDPAMLGKPQGKPVAYADWKGDPRKAFWYLDEEMATAVQGHMTEQLAKKPQQLGFIKNGAPVTSGGMFSFSPKYFADGATFKVEATFIDHLTGSKLYPQGMTLEHGETPILYHVNSGGLVQVGPDSFRVCPRAGPISPQGNPWEPTIVAYTLGDATFRPTERPAHVNVNIVNTAGAAQTLDFPKIPDVRAAELTPIKLSATASSGLPAQFFMVSGPATIDGDTMTFDKIPARAKFPIHVLVAAFQWGRPGAPQVRSAGPVAQEFFIQK